MKSPKDFAKVWGILPANAGKKLKRLGAKPVEWKGRVPYYTDEYFTEVTGKKSKPIPSNLISSKDIQKKYINALEKSIKRRLSNNGIQVKLVQDGNTYYDEEEVKKMVENSQKREKKPQGKKLDTNANMRYRISIFAKTCNKFCVKYAGLSKEDCAKRIAKLFEEGWDFCVRGYEIERF